MPPRDAERDALVQLIFGCVRAGSVHHALQLVLLHRSSAVEQGRWLARVEMDVGFPGVDLVYEVILGLLKLRLRDDVSVDQSLAVVLVALYGGLHVGSSALCSLVAAGLLWPQWGEVHVASHRSHARAHVAHLTHAARLHSWHAAI